MMALVALREDQNRSIVPPGGTAISSEVKNSMRGAFGLMVGVMLLGSGVLVGPNNGVGDGPPTMRTGTFDGVGVGLAFRLAVGDAVIVKVGVIVGRAVGMICTLFAAQPLIHSAMTTIRFRIRNLAFFHPFRRSEEIIIGIYTEILPTCESHYPEYADQILH